VTAKTLNVEEALALARSHFQTGRLAQAQKLCIRIQQTQLTNTEIFFILGMNESSIRSRTEAI
jgi:hypothetical protein